MKINGFHASPTGGKQAFAVSLIMALVLASFSVVSAFAAPPTPPPPTNNNNSLQKIWGNQFSDLVSARDWFNNFKAHPERLKNSSDQARMQRYLAEYAFALGRAEAIIKSGSPNGQANNSNGNSNSSSSSSNNSSSSSSTQKWGSPEQLLNIYLQWMRGLRMKIENGGPSGISGSAGGTP